MELGVKVRDVVTGFQGVVTGYCVYLSGCHQALVVGRSKKGGDAPASWIDEQRLEILPAKKIRLDNSRGAGFDKQPPVR